MGEPDFEDDPWSEDDGEVSAAATHGSASCCDSSWTDDDDDWEEEGGDEEEEEGEEERWGDDDSYSDYDDDGADGGENDGFVGGSGGRRRSVSEGRGGGSSAPAMEVRGGGGGGCGHPTERRMMGQQWHSVEQRDDQNSDDGEWSAGFEPIASENQNQIQRHPPDGGAELADKIEWEAGFDGERQRQNGLSGRDGDHGERSAAGCRPSVSHGTGGEGDEPAAAATAARAAARRAASAEEVKRGAGVVERVQGGTEDAAEWSAGFGSVADDPEESYAAGGGAASAGRVEWDAGFDESDFGSGFAREGEQRSP